MNGGLCQRPKVYANLSSRSELHARGGHVWASADSALMPPNADFLLCRVDEYLCLLTINRFIGLITGVYGHRQSSPWVAIGIALTVAVKSMSDLQRQPRQVLLHPLEPMGAGCRANASDSAWDLGLQGFGFMYGSVN